MTDEVHTLSAVEPGGPNSGGPLIPLFNHGLRKLAALKMVNQRPGQTLQGTVLYREAYVRLADEDRPPSPG
jgi:hypothetical protein